MTTPSFEPDRKRRRRGWRRGVWRFVRGKRRQWMLASLLSFMLALVSLALPLAALADANSLTSYGATASGWGIQPYILNDAFLNVPAADQAAPYVFVSMDNTPGSAAKASYLFPGTAINAVPNTQGVAVSVPTGVDARFPGNGSASSQVNAFNDGVATQATAGGQSAQASEGYATAHATIANYQFAPPPAPAVPPPPSVPGVPGAPTPPAVPTISGGALTPTVSSGSGGSPAPTATPAPPAPSPTTCTLIIFCSSSSTQTMASAAGSIQGTNGATQTGAAPAGGLPVTAPITLPAPDAVEQQLSAALKALQVANPTLLNLSGGQLAAPNATLPYASADVSSKAETRATDAGVTATVVTNLQHIELFQGLITFATVESSLQANAPASSAQGSGSITTRITGGAVAGIPVTVDQNGVTVNDQNISPAQVQALSDQLNAALSSAGVHISLAQTVTKTDVGYWEGSGAGLEITAEVNPASAGLPSPASGVPGTHVDFSIGNVTASIYAVPGIPSGGTDNSGSGGYYGGGSYATCSGGSSPSVANSPPSTTSNPAFKGSFLLPAGLTGGGLLALVFVVQGVSTAAVAAAAGFTDPRTISQLLTTEEETR